MGFLLFTRKLSLCRYGVMDLEMLAQEVGEALQARGLMVTTAESCTGGWVAKVLTDIAGSSNWFERGFVTYSNEAKQEMLSVKLETLMRCGAVSEPTVIEMAQGALKYSQAGISIAVSGVAGPGGGTPQKPIGTVWFAWALKAGGERAVKVRFSGDRESIRRQSVECALQGVLSALKQ